MQLQENTLFANRYALQKLLGRGGFSEVWLAKDNWTHLHIALKVYAPGQGMDANGLQEFCGELASVYDLNHQNLLKPQHVDTWENMPYLIMAYCAQGSCAGKLGKMTETQMWKFIRDVASGLAYLHEKDVVHQDIKPDNILIDDAGNYLITDFGVSTRARSTLRKSVVSSTAGGTTAYMGPERFSRQPAPTKASDIWSFGAMCFELLEGVVPFGEIGGGMQKGGAEIPVIQANVSDALKYTVTKMLQKETWDRPTAATLVEWAKNPQNIEIDHSLLEDGSAPAAPASPAPKPNPGLDNLPTAGHQDTQRLEPQPKEPLKLSVSPANIQVPAGGGNAVVYVNSNAKSWMVRGLATWVHLDKKQTNSFTLQFDKNKSGKNRECSAEIYASENGESVSGLLTISQIPLPKRHTWMIWLLGVAVIIISVFGGVRACSNHQEKIHQEQLAQVAREAEEKARIVEQERLAAEERARQAEEQLKAEQERKAAEAAKKTKGSHCGHDWVDLGLSVKWATCNLGAQRAEEYGHYYAWGETQPVQLSEHLLYPECWVSSWDTYKYGGGVDDIHHLTKYCTESSFGIVDNKTQLDLDDDAARVNWGGRWRMPTYAEFRELLNNCSWTWTTQNGINGYKFKSKRNGNSIFLPAAGYDYQFYIGEKGWYWSKSLRADYSCGAWNLWFTPKQVSTHGLSGSAFRRRGYSVRPVCP